MSMPNALRIARSDPIPSDPPRFVVAGQAGTASGDVKMYEWHRKVGGDPSALVAILMPPAGGYETCRSTDRRRSGTSKQSVLLF